MLRSVCLTVASIALAGCQTATEQAALQVGTATIAGQAERVTGMARVFALDGRVTVNIAMRGLPGARHAVRLHAIGDCSAEAYTSAGSLLVYIGSGDDLPVARDGTGTMSAALSGTEPDILSRIFDADGTAIIVYGDQERPIACGVLRPL